MSIDGDEVTLKIVKNSVSVYKNRKYYGSIGAPDVVDAFTDQDEIVLQYYNPRTHTQRYQAFNLRLHPTRSGGGEYKPRSRTRRPPSIKSDSDADQSRNSGGFGAGLGVFLLVLAWLIYSLNSPETSSPTFEDGVEAFESEDISGAIAAWRPLAERGDVSSQVNLGVAYRIVGGSENNEEMAVYWFREAANQGSEVAQFNLGIHHHQGIGVAQDYRQAVEWYSKAAEQGHVGAINNLGAMYMHGLGVNQDYTQAMEWFVRAAEQGHASAQYNIGLIFKNGWGVERDHDQAEKWLTQAADQGDSNAVNALVELRN